MDATISAQQRSTPSSQSRWMPEWGEERISNMIATRPDWCISRQRVWGVPIIVFYCEGCREPLTDRKILDAWCNCSRAHADIWYERTAAELLPPGVRLRQVRRDGISAKRTTFWTSGSIPARATWPCSTPRFGLRWPADMYIEGGDQYRGWFQSSLLVGVGLKGGAPYRACATDGWVLDGEGRAMHKSLGNAIEPEESSSITAPNAAAVVGSVEFTEDVRLSPDHPDAAGPRPTASCATRSATCSATCTISIPRPTRCRRTSCSELDQWILVRAEDLVAAAAPGTTNFEFHKVYRAVYDFATVDLSSIYFDVLKDRLYTSAAKSHARRSAQTALYRLLDALVRLLAPILSFTTEEVWTHMGRPGSVHTAVPGAGRTDRGLGETRAQTSANWDRLMESARRRAEEPGAARNEKLIGAPLEARVAFRPMATSTRCWNNTRASCRRCSSFRKWK
jgi:isoleucyl-tRNA synthetase